MDLTEVLKGKRAALLDEEATITTAAAEAGGLEDEQRDRLATIHTEITGLDTDLVAQGNAREHIRNAPAALVEGPITPLGEYAQQIDSRSVGAQFVDSEGWKNYSARVAPNGSFSKNARVESDKIEVGSLLPPRRGSRPQALITGGSATSAGALSIPTQSGIYEEGAFQRELTIRDVITVGTTDSDAVEYVKVTGFTNNAAIVPEADSTDPTDETGLKPESTMTFLRVLESVKTIAHWVAATKRALSDPGQLRTLVDNFLRYGLDEELEDQIIAGDGNGDNFQGLLDPGTNIQSQTFVTDNLTTARKAKTKVRTVGKARANAYLFHPNDWERIDLEMTLGGPGSNFRQASDESPPRLWRLPVVESEAVPEGTGIVGDFRKIVLWDREQTTIQASDGVNNFFLKNMVAILAEMRAAMGIIRPDAFVAFAVGETS